MSTAVPVALTALQAKATSVLTGVEVTVGPNFDPGGDYLCIGWVDEHNPGVTSSSNHADAALAQDLQQYEIHCAIAVHRGNELLTEAISDAYGYYNALEAAIKLDMSLGHSVARTVMGHSNLLLSVTERGRMAALRFVITVRTWK